MRPAHSGMLFVLAFEAGLLTGLSHFWAPACVLVLIAMVLGGGNRLPPGLVREVPADRGPELLAELVRRRPAEGA